MAVIAALVAYGMGYEPFAVRLKRIRLLCPRLPREFDGFTVLQLSDLHMSQMGRRERNIHRLVRRSRPDVVALTGDLASDDVAARDMMRIVQDAEPRSGVFAISGNADLRYEEEWLGVKRVLRGCGVEMLENGHRVITRGDAQIVVAGVDDPHTGQDNLKKALSGAPEETFILLLAHSPVMTVGAVEMGADVVLSGHTHGGQVALPLVGPLLTRSGHGKKLASGLWGGKKLRSALELDPRWTQVYVSRGIGSSFIPLRFLCPPEVALFELRCASGGGQRMPPV